MAMFKRVKTPFFALWLTPDPAGQYLNTTLVREISVKI